MAKDLEFFEYAQSVRANRGYFDGLDLVLQEKSKQMSGISKQFNSGRKLDAKSRYGGFSVEEEVEAIIASRPLGLEVNPVLWYVMFDAGFSKSVEKWSLEDVFRERMVRKDRYAQVSCGVSFIHTVNCGDYKVVEREEEHIANHMRYRKERPMDIIKDTQKKHYLLEEGLGYMVKNLDVLPSSVRRALKKMDSESASAIEIRELQDGLQYNVYLRTLKPRFSEAYLRNEIKRFTMNYKDSKPKLIAAMLVFNAFFERYGYEKVMSKAYAWRIVNNSINRLNNVKALNEREARLALTPEMFKAMSFSTMKCLGFSLQSEWERGIVPGA